MFGWTFLQPNFHLEEKDEPVALPAVIVFAHNGREVQIAWRDLQTEFLLRLAAGASIRRFPIVGVNLAAARTPEATIGFLRSFEQQHFVALIENVKQGGDSVR